jgi:hypothetical protein
MKRRIFGSLLAVSLSLSAVAQISSTVSPYSQFGYGVLSDQSQSFSRGMSGLSIGLRSGKVVNILNPASYSAVDSLTMILDAGVSGQISNFKEGGKKVNGKTGTFDYAVASFRLLKKVGFAVGVVPFTNVGYTYSRDSIDGSSSSYSEMHVGDGGMSQVFIGAGWEVFPGFSVGANFSYLWGDWAKTVMLVSADSYVNTLTRIYTVDVSSYKLDFGLQWQTKLGKDNMLTLGATLGVGHQMKSDASLITANTNSQSDASSTVDTLYCSNALSMPFSFGFGTTFLHKGKLLVGFDYQLQKWGSMDYPSLTKRQVDGVMKNVYVKMGGLLKDRHKIVVGADWIPNPLSRRSILHRVHYRVGASYATPYYKIGTQDGPKEITLSAGLGIPLINSWNNRSTLNISAQWVHNSASGLVTENGFRINIGLTFNERWFAKWKVD